MAKAPAQISDMENWVSPKSQRRDFNDPYTLKDKIRIFEERVDGWQISIAEIMLRQIKDKTPVDMQHAAYALVSVVFSYFEMIGECVDPGPLPSGHWSEMCAQIRGFVSRLLFWCTAAQTESRSAACFKRGLADVFPGFSGKEMQKIYRKVRCGMYHVAYTKKGVVIDGDFTDAFHVKGERIEMNPHLLVPAIRGHFNHFIEELKGKDRSNPMIKRFESLFDR